MRRLLLGVMLATALLGCSTLLPYLVKGAEVAAWITTILDRVEVEKDRVFAASPNADLQATVDEAITKTRAAIAAYNSAIDAATSANDGDVAATRDALLATWDELLPLLEATGMLDAAGDLLGASEGERIDIPTRAEIEARLQ